ncbi:MAG TPA: hypothetical protein OQH54_08080, partial [Nitrosopumilus sp.]|nr:hypothetical protein [Nitrosopumilus sp.]
MNKNDFFIVGLFSILLILPITAVAENSSVTVHGVVMLDSTIYVLEPKEIIFAQISGVGDVPQGVEHEKATIIITQPDGTTVNHRIFSASDGYFELIFPLGYDSQIGTYKVFVTFAGQILGELYFEVQREDPFNTKDNDSEEDRTFPPKTPTKAYTFTVETDLNYYEKGDDIHISGIVEDYAMIAGTNSGGAVSIIVIDSKNSIIAIDQVKPNLDGAFSTTIKTDGNVWSLEGDYTIKSMYDNEEKLTFFELSIPKTASNIPNPITPSINKIKTTLTLDNFQNTYSTSTSSVYIPISGYLTADGNGQADATILIMDNGSRLADTLQTDSSGYFSGDLIYDNENSYHEIQVIYDGTDYFKSSKSQIEKFDISPQTTSTPPQYTSNPFDPTWIIVIVVLSVIIGIAVIAL